ncbi:TetR/AcrR family transcriptional regulator [Kribbella kalugense]|uniref:TetR family transcriptional regulator n=1 Tax=Kribbella kalugense TaxID=2512221 RepID=A0A4R7ZK59_9ACTN|nr:TetR/AcrR family transcriptional regulator C-terminal domain-containing protein [Kribbella kalugense]TDW17566.1 TetR family transcriptional regulator [Kribbella kalugense]
MREADRRTALGSVWLRDEPEPTRARLSREDIVRTAIQVLDREGLDTFSMRRMAAELGAAATSALYWRIANKDDLLELVVDEIFALSPAPEGGDWRDQVTVVVQAAYHALWEHPWAARLLASHAGLGPNYDALTNRVQGILDSAGFKGTHLDSAVSAIFHYLIGAAVTDSAWLSVVRRSGLNDSRWATESADRMGVGATHLAAYLNRQSQAGPEARFASGLRVILIGLRPRQLS